MIAPHFSKRLVGAVLLLSRCFFTALLLPVLQGCAPRRASFPKAQYRNKGHSEGPFTTRSSPSGPSGFWLVQQNRPAIDPQGLNIYRLSVARYQLSEEIYPLISFSVDGMADYVSWELCPRSGQSSCMRGTSAVSEVLPGQMSAGSYTIAVRACVHKARSLNPEHLCSRPHTLEYRHPLGKTVKILERLYARLRSYEKDLRALGPVLWQILQNFRKDIRSCSILNNRAGGESVKELEIKVISELEIQVENLLNLGQEYLGESLAFVRLDEREKEDEELAKILIAIRGSETQAGSGYQPGGLSLSAGLAIGQVRAFFEPRVHTWSTRGQLVPELNIRDAILGSSGLVLGPSGLDAHSDAHDRQGSVFSYRLWEKRNGNTVSNALLFAGLLSLSGGLGLSSSSGPADYAMGEFTRAMLFLHKPGLLPSCHAWTRVEAGLSSVRRSIRVTREQLASLKMEMDEKAANE